MTTAMLGTFRCIWPSLYVLGGVSGTASSPGVPGQGNTIEMTVLFPAGSRRPDG